MVRQLGSRRCLLTHLDTHVAIWLCSGEIALSTAALAEIESSELAISPIVLLEMQFLQEIGRLNASPEDWLRILTREFGVSVSPTTLYDVVQAARIESWTRDPFDRLIVAQARTAGAKLITRDRKIREHFELVVW